MQLFRNAMAVAMLAAAAVPAPQARAASVVSNAAGACQGSLPIYNANLRKRPLGILNEGATSAFLSCGLQWGVMPGNTPQTYVTATNRNATAVDLTCTLLDGYPIVTGEPFARVYYHPKTISIAADSTASIVWDPSDYYVGAHTFTGYENFSCNVPAGVEINRAGYDYDYAPS